MQAFDLALDAQKNRRFKDAEDLYRKVISDDPSNFDALHMLGIVCYENGKISEAEQFFLAALSMDSKYPPLFHNYGLFLAKLKRYQESIVQFDKALKLFDKFAPVYCDRGISLMELGRLDESLASHNVAANLAPNIPTVFYNRANTLFKKGNYDSALRDYARALTLHNNYADAYCGYGNALTKLKRYDEAIAAYDKTLALEPAFAEAWLGRGNGLCELRRYDEALGAFDKAIALKPDFAEAWFGRGNIYFELNRNDGAVADFQRAFAIRPDFAEARFAACFAELPILYKAQEEIISQREAYEGSLRALDDDVEAGHLQGDLVKAIEFKPPFYLAYQGRNDRDLQRLYGSMVCRIMEREFPNTPLAPPPARGEPVRVGFVSKFFYMHSNWKLYIKGWMSQLDRKRFKIFGYHLGSEHDRETDVAVAMCERFVHGALTIDSWRREILADAPHVLIYPGLLMDHISVKLAGLRLAAVQCNSWGHPETSGMPTVDYFLSSDLMEPLEAAEHYTEQLVRLPNLSL